MITGKVGRRGAVVHLDLHGPTGLTRTINALVDTGFNAFLTLPPDVIQSLQLPSVESDTIQLANDEMAELNCYAALATWDGTIVPIYVHESTVFPLLGLGLLAQQELTMQVRRGGKVTITPLKTP
jgi:clan AA aspartic protease